MRIGDYLRLENIDQADTLRRHLALIVLAITNLVTALALILRPTPVILVPPDLPEAVEISRSDASGALKETWGLFIAELLGNITPGNADFVENSIGPLIDAGIYRELMEAVSRDLEALKADRVSVRFRTREVFHDQGKDQIYVTGELSTQGPSGPPRVTQRTYQFRIRFRHYRPTVMDLEVYPGSPRGLDPAASPIDHKEKNPT